MTNKIACLCVGAMLTTLFSFAQNAPADSLQQDSLRRIRQAAQQAMQQATSQDYKTMLAQLHIDSTQPGPSGKPNAPDAAGLHLLNLPAGILNNVIRPVDKELFIRQQFAFKS